MGEQRNQLVPTNDPDYIAVDDYVLNTMLCKSRTGIQVAISAIETEITDRRGQKTFFINFRMAEEMSNSRVTEEIGNFRVAEEINSESGFRMIEGVSTNADSNRDENSSNSVETKFPIFGNGNRGFLYGTERELVPSYATETVGPSSAIIASPNAKAHKSASPRPAKEKGADSLLPCSRCGKAFRQLSMLKRHMTIHEGDLRCPVKNCKATYKIRTTLTKHLINNHGGRDVHTVIIPKEKKAKK